GRRRGRLPGHLPGAAPQGRHGAARPGPGRLAVLRRPPGRGPGRPLRPPPPTLRTVGPAAPGRPTGRPDLARGGRRPARGTGPAPGPVAATAAPVPPRRPD